MQVITVGRSEENDRVITDPCTSRHHLQIIQHDDGHFTLSDFGSTNGTYVNGQKINGEIQLNDTDIVRIGNTTIPWRMYFEEEQISAIDDSSKSKNDDAKEIKNSRKRHGFVTFWLWLGIVMAILSPVYSVMFSQKIDKISRYLFFETSAQEKSVVNAFRSALTSHLSEIELCSLLSAILTIIFNILILRWRKIGFWCNMGSSIVFCVINLYLISLIQNDYSTIGLTVNINYGIAIIPVVTSSVILWAVLQIKKNGVSCWKQLK